MSNNTQYNITVNADGVYTALDKAQSSYDKFAVTVDLAAKKAAAGQAALDEALKVAGDSTVRAQRQVQSFMNALVQEASTAGMTRTQLLELKAAQLGVSDSAAKYIKQISDANKAVVGSAGGAHAGMAGITRELIVMGHEGMSGNFSRMPGSFMVLAERINIVSVASKAGTAALEAMGIAGASTGAALGVVAAPLIAIAAAGYTVYEGRKDLLAYADGMTKLASETGQTTAQVQQFAFMAANVGVSADDAGKALGVLDKAQNDAIHGNGNAAKAFQALGISMAQLKEMSPDEVLARTADAFSHTSDGASKTAIAVELFGESGKQLIPLLDQGSAKLQALHDDALKYGAVLDGNAPRRSAVMSRWARPVATA